MQLVLNETAQAQWMALVEDAEHACELDLGADLKSYLIFLLMRHINHQSLSSGSLALDFLEGLEFHGRLRQDRLTEVGDQCLLVSGLFPGRAERRRVSVGYYVDLGSSAYALLGDLLRGAQAALFESLARHFVALMDILHAARELGTRQPALEPLQAMELWSDTGSAHAFATLRRYSAATPVKNTLLPRPVSLHQRTYNALN